MVAGATPSPVVPPAYRLVRLRAGDDPLSTAVAAARRAPEDGLLLWCDRADRLECAVLLEPDLPLQPSLLVVYVALLGLGDALGALVPPVLPVLFGWPDRLRVNGAEAGRVTLAVPAGAAAAAVPPWLAVGISVAVAGDPADLAPGRDRRHTTLHDEGCGDLTVPHLLESFSRHFLSWITRWQEDGLAPVRDAWLGRLEVERQADGPRLAHPRRRGTPLGLDAAGGLELQVGRRRVRLRLEQALRLNPGPA